MDLDYPDQGFNPLTDLWKHRLTGQSLSPLDDLLRTQRLRIAIIFRTDIPQKLLHLRTLIDSELNAGSLLSKDRVTQRGYVPILSQAGSQQSCTQEKLVGLARGDHWLETVARNTVQSELTQLLIREYEDLHMLVMDLRIWLELEIPTIDDGDMFGAEVQGDIIEELEDIYDDSIDSISTSRDHHIDRLEMAKEWVKFPNIMDYPAVIPASDRMDHLIARSFIRDLLRTYGVLLAKFSRNWTKIIDPSGTGR